MKYNRPSLVDNIIFEIYGKEIYSGNLLQKITVKKTEKAKAKPLDNYKYCKSIKIKKLYYYNFFKAQKKVWHNR